jgi:hypothetical protein
MKFITTAIWTDTLATVREIKKITREPQALIFHRLVTAELEWLQENNEDRRQVRSVFVTNTEADTKTNEED